MRHRQDAIDQRRTERGVDVGRGTVAPRDWRRPVRLEVLRVSPEHGTAARGRAEHAALPLFDEAGARHVDSRPVGAMLEDRRAAVAQHRCVPGAGQVEGRGELAHGGARARLAVGSYVQERQHQALVVRELRHRAVCPFFATGSRPDIWKA